MALEPVELPQKPNLYQISRDSKDHAPDTGKPANREPPQILAKGAAGAHAPSRVAVGALADRFFLLLHILSILIRRWRLG